MSPSSTAEYEITSSTRMWKWCVCGKSNRSELKSLSSHCSWIPCQWIADAVSGDKTLPSYGSAYDWQLCTTRRNIWEFNGGDNAHKKAKDSKDVGNTSSLILMTFSTKSLWALKNCCNYLSFNIKRIRVSFRLFLMSIFIRVHQLQKILFFTCPIPWCNLPQHFEDPNDSCRIVQI